MWSRLRVKSERRACLREDARASSAALQTVSGRQITVICICAARRRAAICWRWTTLGLGRDKQAAAPASPGIVWLYRAPDVCGIAANDTMTKTREWKRTRHLAARQRQADKRRPYARRSRLTRRKAVSRILDLFKLGWLLNSAVWSSLWTNQLGS